ncbi:hypothetical protein C0214_22035 [Methylobacterium sp. DM1]|nr:hypothetical protein C0214_22035 [Methylobacterium sp. DM1]
MTLEIDIPTNSGNIHLAASPGRPLFIIGRNGTGKSALMQYIVYSNPNNHIYLPGSRPSYFDKESLSLTPATRQELQTNLRFWNSHDEVRWKSRAGTSRNEKAIHDLTVAETQYKLDAANEIVKKGKEAKSILKLQLNDSPVDNVNNLLAQANLPVKLIVDKAELKAVREGKIYSIARMSDGERTAPVIISEVVSADKNSTFIIDEPELHLH